ncbi:MAG TPA: hypothetical protein VGF89_08335 [Steroidobacteraceae bacterium]
MPSAISMDGTLIRQAILGEVALQSDMALQIDSHGVRLSDATVEGGLDLTAVAYDRPILFERCTFLGAIMLTRSKLDSFSLKDCRMLCVDARGAEIHGDLTISGGSLENPGQFAFNGHSMSVNGSVLFVDDLDAAGAVSLAWAQIGRRVVCNGTFRNPPQQVTALNWFEPIHCAINGFGVRIGKSLSFNSHMHAAGSFRAEGFVVFANATITDGIYFIGGSITAGHAAAQTTAVQSSGDSATRYVIKAGAGLSLHNVQMGELVLSGIERFEGLLSLRAAVIRTIADDATFWRDPVTGLARSGMAIELDGCTYRAFTHNMVSATPVDWRVRLQWLKAQIPQHLSTEFRSQPFTQCAEVLRKMGDDHGARMILFERERLRLQSGDARLWDRIVGRAFGVVAGHGYKNYYALYWALGIWLAGAAVFGIANRLGEMRPASEHVIVDETYQRTGRVPSDYEPLKAVLFSADVLLPIVDFSQKRFWLPRDAGERAPDAARAFPSQPEWLTGSLNWLFAGWFPKLYYYFEIAMGWVLASIAVAGFSGHLARKGEE